MDQLIFIEIDSFILKFMFSGYEKNSILDMGNDLGLYNVGIYL